MTQPSRAEYMKERRKRFAQFTVSIPTELNAKITEHLKQQGKTKTQWVIEKIIDELSQKMK